MREELSKENHAREHVAKIIDEQLRSAFRLRESLSDELNRSLKTIQGLESNL